MEFQTNMVISMDFVRRNGDSKIMGMVITVVWVNMGQNLDFSQSVGNLIEPTIIKKNLGLTTTQMQG
jgi:hypothetical protein